MSDDEQERWILPSAIPFGELKGHRLEECIFWVLDGLGAKNLEWRVGGTGGGAADGGRDIVATFFVPDDTGQMQERRWWIECKGRSGTVEKEAVATACNNVTAYAGVDHLVIATNTQFSNPTRDWVATWQVNHPATKILLWDRAELERMLSRQPSTVLRLFRDGLSLSGKLEAMRERYWNLMEYSSIEHIKAIWSERATLEIGPMERVALVANEFAHGDIDERPWCGGDDPDATRGALTMVLFNFIFLFSKWMKSGVDQGPFVRTVAYVLAASLRHIEPAQVIELIDLGLRAEEGVSIPATAKEYFLGPALDRLNTDLTLVCTAHCPRFYRSDSVKGWQSEDPLDRYWYRFRRAGTARRDQSIEARLVNTREPCAVGLEIAEGGSCPIYDAPVSFENLGEFLSVAAHVLRVRVPVGRSPAPPARRPPDRGPA